MRQIIQKKQNNQNLLCACLLPPPTDFIVWDFRFRRQLLSTYNLPSGAGEQLSEEIANDPIPAYTLLDNFWTQYRQRSGRAPSNQVLTSIRNIARLFREGIISILEPNTHAKFVATDNGIYEGSGNLTRFGLEVNVEVYNFYPVQYQRIYDYSWRSYETFLIDYFTRFVSWKSGATFVQNARLFRNEVIDIMSKLGLRFNPRIPSEKIFEVSDIYNRACSLRTELWMINGHVNDLKMDFLLKNALDIIYNARSMMFEWRDEEVDSKVIDDIHNKFKISSLLLENVKKIIPKTEKESNIMTEYEMEYGGKTVMAADAFLKYLKRVSQKFEKI